ncbi:MAG TPA: TonB-dependent receptor [Acidobacteriaceae bacterium]|nr:TonB-dependent receptor [Acidobacteriaceae bacterium]
MRKYSGLAAGCALFAALCFCTTLQAQAVYGSINGTVTDNTGAVVPNATITVTDVAKGTSVTTTSNASGEYTVQHLIPDTYDVKVEAQGFQTFSATGVQVLADTSPKIDAAMKVGAASQTVEVSASTIPELKTDRADVSTEFTTREVQDLPIPDRNFTNMQLLLPGAQPLGWGHASDENPQGSKQIQVDGQAFGGVAFELDGTDNQDPILGIIVINPPLDALSETKITTQNFDAEFGKAVSSFVTAQTKSGSNQFHGSAFDYRESNANLATDPYSQYLSATTTKSVPAGLKNQFGGSIGGPVLKDRLFFFGDYQGVRQKVGIADSNITVPTAHLISTCLGQSTASNGVAGCDFSEYAAAEGIPNSTTPYLLYDPSTGAPYATNVIPAAELSQPALNLLKLLQPYAKGTTSATKNNYSANGTGLFNSNQWDVRVDDQVASNIHAFARFSRFTSLLSGSTVFGDAGGPGFGIQGYGGKSNGADDSLASGMDIAVSPKLLTDFRLAYYRYGAVTSKYDQGTSFATQLGIPGMNMGDSFTSGAPAFNIADVDVHGNNGPNNPQSQGSQYGSGLNINRCNCPLTQKEDQFQIVNNWTKIYGNHSLKFGVDLRYARNLRVPSDNDRTGILSFGSGPTSNNGATSTGLGFASFVLGDVTQFQRYVSVSTNAKEFQKRFFFYAQDTWHARPNLTVNIGTRYEFYFPESVNGKGNGSLMPLNGGSGGYQTDGYFHVAGYGNVPTNMGWSSTTNTWNPRIGVAWQPDSKTVVRSGYGRSFDLGVFGSIFGHVVTQNLPVLANQNVNAPTTTTPAFTLAAGPPKNVFPSVPSSGLLPVQGYAISPKARPDSLRLPTLDAWNLSVQRSITPTLSVTVAYVGNKGTHTLSDGDGNNTNPNEAAINLPAQYSVTGQPLHYDSTVPTGTVQPGGPAGIPGIAADGGTAVSNYLSRFYGGGLTACTDPNYATPVEPGITRGMCGWTNGINYYGDDQDTHFNALQVSLAQQMSRGLSFNVQYAWQRGIDYANGYATWDKRPERGRDGSIREQQFVVYGIYEVPFGKGRRWATGVPRWEDEVIGGWEFSPVLNWSSGLPFTLGVGGGCGSTLPGSAPCYPNGSGKQVHTHLTKFDPVSHSRTYFTKADVPSSKFPAAGLDKIGTMGRNSVYGPHYFSGDLSLQKNFPIYESVLAQFRIDAYNGFNHINPGNPGTTQTDSNAVINSEPALNVYTNPRQLQFSLRVQF